MVFFVCGGCGGSFKRKQADQHTFRCRNWAFSCMDCNKDFPGQSYVQHTQCITESEKYFGNHHVVKAGKDKNEAWMTKLREQLTAQTGLKPYIANLVSRILSYPNIPRKQAKFENFLKTSMNMSHKPTVEELWRLVSKAGSSNKENNSTNGIGSLPPASQRPSEAEVEEKEEEEQTDGDTKQKKERKRKLEENADEDSEERTESSSADNEPKKKKKKRKAINGDGEVSAETTSEQKEESDKNNVKESKSARRRRLKEQQQSATGGTDLLASAKNGFSTDPVEQEKDLVDCEDIAVVTVDAEKNFKWRQTMKKLIRDAPSEGIKVTKLLKKIEQLYNNPLSGASQPLPKDTLQTMMVEMLEKKPFSVVKGRACIVDASK